MRQRCARVWEREGIRVGQKDLVRLKREWERVRSNHPIECDKDYIHTCIARAQSGERARERERECAGNGIRKS